MNQQIIITVIGHTHEFDVKHQTLIWHPNDSNATVAIFKDIRTVGYSSEGEDRAIDDLKEAVKTFLKAHLHLNTLDSALTKFGWSKAIDGDKIIYSKQFEED